MPNQYNAAPKIIVKCPCGNEFKTTQKRITEGRGKFCSHVCKVKYCPMPKRVKGDQKTYNYNSGWYKKGHITWSSLNKGKYTLNPDKVKKGYHNSPETEFKKDMDTWNKGKKMPEMSGENHPNWVGDNISYIGLHAWIHKNFIRPLECDRCNTMTPKRFEWHNKSGEYKRDRSDWEFLCSKCHVNHHKNYQKTAAWKKRHGH